MVTSGDDDGAGDPNDDDVDDPTTSHGAGAYGPNRNDVGGLDPSRNDVHGLPVPYARDHLRGLRVRLWQESPRFRCQ